MRNSVHSVVDPDSVYIYLQPDPSKPLLTDTDGDGYCDNLITEDPDTAVRLPLQKMSPLAPTGSSWFGSLDDDTAGGLESEFPIDATSPTCSYASGGAPVPLCPKQDSDMTRVISWEVKTALPCIFALGPNAEACTGIDWQINKQPGVSEGWLCVAALARDHAGNVGISQPLRLCYDDSKGADPSCLDTTADPPPTCTDGCILPPKLASFKTQL